MGLVACMCGGADRGVQFRRNLRRINHRRARAWRRSRRTRLSRARLPRPRWRRPQRPNSSRSPSLQGIRGSCTGRPWTSAMTEWAIAWSGPMAAMITGPLPKSRSPKGGWQVHADWSPDGSLLAFAVDDATDDSKPPDLITRRSLDLAARWHRGRASARLCAAVRGGGLSGVVARWLEDRLQGVRRERWRGGLQSSLDGCEIQGRHNSGDRGRVPTSSREPRWSPDGQRIVLELSHWTDRDLRRAHRDCDRCRRPTRLGADAEGDHGLVVVGHLPRTGIRPRISSCSRPDRGRLLDDGPSNLFTVRPDGSDITQLTKFGAGEDASRAAHLDS